MSWLKSIFGGEKKEGGEGGADRVLELEREVRALKLEIEERDKKLRNVSGDLERQRGGESTRVAEAVQGQLEGLVADGAAPAVQLLTQEHLLEKEGKPVQAKDVLAVAKRLVRALEGAGVKFEGEIGAAASYDPDLHDPIGGGEAPSKGDAVTVKFRGVSFRGRVIRKAGVAKV